MSTLISITLDEGANLQGYLAIDSTINDRCYGGVRMASDLSPDLITKVARAMTLKYGFVGLPVGGAKAGIAADPEMPQDRKRELLKSFSQTLRPFLQTKTYIPGSDLGTTDDDISFMLTSIGLKVPPRSLAPQLSGFYTGITVFTAAISAARHIGLDLSRATVAIEGFGSVGTSTAQAFWKNGIRVVAISTSRGAIYNEKGLDIGALIKLHHRAGNQVVNEFARGEKIDKSRLAELDIDIFSPCAQPYSINSDNANRVLARIISPGANAPLTDEAEQILFQRGILSIPDFIANCGGILGTSMKRTGLKEDFIRRFMGQKISEQVPKVIKAAEKENVTLRVYAERIAEERFLRAKAVAEKRNIPSRAFNFALELYRKGILPYWLVTPIASGYFERRFR